MKPVMFLGAASCLALGWALANRASREGAAVAAPIASGTCEEELARVRAELAACRASVASTADLRTEIGELKLEIANVQRQRMDREQEWLRYTQGFTALAKMSGAELPHFEAKPPVATGEGAAAKTDEAAKSGEPATGGELASAGATLGGTTPDATPDAATKANSAPPELLALAESVRAERSQKMLQKLRSLFLVEEIGGLDLLEAGLVQQGYMGPVVLRVLDDRGRGLGSLSADRMRLEASRAARTITLILEDGYERRAGVATPFAGGPVHEDGRGGVRRIVFDGIDPRPWIEGLPELFAPDAQLVNVDDGLHDLAKLRLALNAQLRLDAANGTYRIERIGGVQGDLIREVSIDDLDKDGRIERKLFADKMSVLRETRGLQLSLEGGSQTRGDEQLPFLDGHYRIFLPRAEPDAWTKAGIPIVPLPK